MAKEILKDEILNQEQLDNVAGGSWIESVGDFNEASKRKIPGLIKTLRQKSEGF